MVAISSQPDSSVAVHMLFDRFQLVLSFIDVVRRLEQGYIAGSAFAVITSERTRPTDRLISIAVDCVDGVEIRTHDPSVEHCPCFGIPGGVTHTGKCRKDRVGVKKAHAVVN